MSDVRLVLMTAAQRDHLRWLSETARRLSVDERTRNPAKFKADSEAAVALADAYEQGITEAEVIGSYLCEGCHDKLRAAFKESP